MVRISRILLVYLIAVAFSGCVVIPIPTKEQSLMSGRGQIPSEVLTNIEKGKTTREEVLLQYGEPSLVLNNQKILVYRWVVSAGGYITLIGFPLGVSGAGGDILKDYLVTLEFDGDGRLVRFERSGSIWNSSLSRINEWVPPESEKLSPARIMDINPMPVPYTESGSVTILPQGVRIQVGEFSDRRSDKGAGSAIGELTLLGKHLIDVYTQRRPVDIIREAASAQLVTMGAQLTDRNPDVIVTGELRSLGVETMHRFFWFDLAGTLECALTVKRISGTETVVTKHYRATCKEHSILSPPRKDHFSTLMRACLENFQQQVCKDPDITRILTNSGAP